MKRLREQYPGRARGLRLRRQGPDLPRRLVPRVQGPARADARGPGAADRADPRGRAAARLAGAGGARHRGRRRHRHAGARGGGAAATRSIISTGDKDLAQLVTPRVTLINTMSNERLDVDGREGQVRRAAGAHRRLPDADRRHGRQRARRRQGRPEDGGQVDRRIRLARRRGRRGRPIKGAVGENLRKALDWLPHGPQADHRA